MSNIREIAKYTFLVALLSVMLKPLGIVKEMVVAQKFGVSQQMDVYFLLISIPVFFAAVMYSALRQSVTPIYLKLQREEKWDESARFVSSIAVIYFLVLFALYLLITVFSSEVIKLFAPGFSDSSLGIALELSPHAFFLLLALGMNNFFMTFLEAEKRFVTTKFLQAAVPISVLIAAVFFSQSGPGVLIVGMTVGFLVAGFIQSLLVLKALLKCPLGLDFRDENLWKAFHTWLPFSLGALVSSGFYVVDRMMVSMLDQGSMATYGYVSVLVTNISSILLVSFSTVLLPTLSEIPYENRKLLGGTVSEVLCLSTCVMLPLAAVVALYSDQIIGLLYQRGQFSAEDGAKVSNLLAVYIFSLVPFSVLTLFARALNALFEVRAKVFAAFLSTLLNLVLNYILMQKLGLIGIAIATIIVHCTVSTFFLFVMRKKHQVTLESYVVSRLAKIAIMTLAGCFVGQFLMAFNIWLSIASTMVSMLTIGLVLKLREIEWLYSALYKRLKTKIAH